MRFLYFGLLSIRSIFGLPQLINDPLARSSGVAGECVQGSCTNGQGQMKFTDNTEFNGAWLNALPTGSGILRKGDRVLYSGIWREGYYIGRCLSGDCIDGIGALEISGCQIKIADKKIFITKICGAHSIYSGFFNKGRKHGRGFLINGNRLETGTYVDDMLSGYCELMDTLGYHYQGECTKNNISGQGHLVFGRAGGANGNFAEFQGILKDGQPLEGTLKLIDGRIFTGRWLADRKLEGVLIQKDKKIKGIWEIDVLQKQ